MTRRQAIGVIGIAMGAGMVLPTAAIDDFVLVDGWVLSPADLSRRLR